jgi:urease accessory protein
MGMGELTPTIIKSMTIRMTTNHHDVMILQNWFSPVFPIGAFSYSHGLEMAIQDGHIMDQDSLYNWITSLLSHGSVRNDAIIIKSAHEGVPELNDLSLALSASKERYQETTELGYAFCRLFNTSYDCDLPEGLAYPVAVGIASRILGLNVKLTIQSYLQAFASNLISVGIRTIPIGQQSGQDCLLRLYPVIKDVATASISATLDDIGGAVFHADLMAMKHENITPRIYRS